MSFFSKLFGKSSPAERNAARNELLPSEDVFDTIRRNAARKRHIEETRLEGKDEVLAHEIKRLLLSASFHASRDPRAFKNLSAQLEKMGNPIRASGQERWYRIKHRVELLSGEHFVGLSQYYDLLGDAP